MAGGGGPGGPGGGFAGGGGDADPKKPDGAVLAFLVALNAKDQDSLSKLISSKATGELEKLRKGELDERGYAKLVEQYGQLSVVQVPPPQKATERIVVIGPSGQQPQPDRKKRSAANTGRKQVVLRQEDGGWKVHQIR
jgi:hypothetical protein